MPFNFRLGLVFLCFVDMLKEQRQLDSSLGSVVLPSINLIVDLDLFSYSQEILAVSSTHSYTSIEVAKTTAVDTYSAALLLSTVAFQQLYRFYALARTSCFTLHPDK
jgi:hypothetical protein